MITSNAFNALRLDEVLKMFVNCEAAGCRIIPRHILFAEGAPADYHKAISFLVEEGCLKEADDGFYLTYKGRMIYDKGGFRHKQRRESLSFYGAMIATIAAVASLVLSIVALCR